jgi:hypothetical protein
MTDTRPRLTPGPDDPISMDPASRTVTVRGYYPKPDQPVGDIAGHVAFCPDRFDFAME